ncbi:MAG: hypothetical protein JKY42_00660, partial [Flavobacteriales bacterium]|nr:hypothetical protein [Flavobacteriales bacterium]
TGIPANFSRTYFPQEVELYLSIAESYVFLGKHLNALEDLFEVEKFAIEQWNNENVLAGIYNSLGVCYGRIGRVH